MQLKIQLALLFVLTLSASATQWAVLVAGSNGFYNYRHQSDICHAYQILINHGISAQNIIVMSYDDVATSSQNPFPNTLFNKPTGAKPGVNVNQGCVIDYKGAAVTPANYLAILQGNSTATKGGNGRVLESKSGDTVFLNFADHGAAGLIAFPSSYLYANQLQAALNFMTAHNMFNQLTYYLESCESGSMFQTLNATVPIYAVSAASPSESSWATYCPPNDIVNGTHIGSCLGDEFSVNWMENTESSNTATETLEVQWQAVKQLTTQSQVMQWGNLQFTNEVVGTFVGMKNGKQNGFLSRMSNIVEGRVRPIQQESAKIDSRNVKLEYMTAMYLKDPNEINYIALVNEINAITRFNKIFTTIKTKLGLQGIYYNNTDWECYQSSVENFESICGKLTEYNLKDLKVLFEYCAVQQNSEYTKLHSLFNEVC